jgi:hypothetical protein
MLPEPYDLSLVHAKERVAAAHADMKEVVGTPAAMFVWMRKASYERALHAQERGLHHIHRLISDVGAACTCGRVVPLDAAGDPLNQPGHLDRNLREIWIVPTALREISPRGQLRVRATALLPLRVERDPQLRTRAALGRQASPAAPASPAPAPTTSPTRGTVMTDLLTIARTRQGRTTVTTLATADSGAFVLTHDGAATYIDVSDPLTAVKSDRRLRTVDGLDTTAIVRHMPDLIDRDALLGALRPTRRVLEPDDESEEDEDWSADLYDVAESWGTWHRVSLDGESVYGVDLGRRTVLIGGVLSDPCRPHVDWQDLLATYWDSSGYSGVGMSGFGGQGVYFVQPGLIAHVVWTDESYDIRFEAVSPRASLRTLALKHGRSAIDSDQDWGLVEQAAYGHTDVEIYEDSSFATVLEAKDLRRLLRG